MESLFPLDMGVLLVAIIKPLTNKVRVSNTYVFIVEFFGLHFPNKIAKCFIQE